MPPAGPDPIPPHAVDWALFPEHSAPYFALAIFLSLLLGAAEVAGAFRDKPQAVRAVLNRWALPYYLLYLLFTYLMGRVLLEFQVVQPGWASAVALGILGPVLFKTQIKLFKPLSGSEGLNANFEKILLGVQAFCFDQIRIDLSHRRIDQKLALVQLDPEQLGSLLRAVYGDVEYQETIRLLIEEREAEDPASVRALMVELIEHRNPDLLEKLSRDGAPGDPPAAA